MKLTSRYVAGLFDGEGWFSIKRTKGRYNRPFVFQIKDHEYNFYERAYEAMREQKIRWLQN